jgi:ABC-type uncharacterized transport system permease subunit
MPLLWLRAAAALYGVGVVYALVALARKREILSRPIMPLVFLGLIFHFVSVVEARFGVEAVSAISFYESLLAFLFMAFFAGMYARYRTTSPGIFVLPAVFLVTLSAALAQRPPQFASPLLRSGWIFVHIALIFLGYAALFLSLAASLLYLIQERNLKQKNIGGFFGRLPALQTIDELGYRSLILGFPFMTVGLIAGLVLAQIEFGASFMADPKIVLSLLMWVAYVVMLYTRWSVGWRGRRAAYLSAVTVAVALTAWIANHFSSMHRFVNP